MGIPVALLNKTATIQRDDGLSTTTQDDLGELTHDWADYYTDWPINIQSLSAEERAMMGSTGVEVSHRGFVNPLGTGYTLTEKDRLVIDSEIYEIIYIDNPAGLDHHWELSLIRLIDGGR